MGRGEAPVLYAVHVRKEAIVGFRYPPSKEDPGSGENIARSGEARVASHLMAVLGIPSPMQRTWDNVEAARFVADGIPGAKVVEHEVMKGSEEKSKDMSRKKKENKTAARKAPKKAPAKGDARECGVCHKLGHNARSHAPGGRLA